MTLEERIAEAVVNACDGYADPAADGGMTIARAVVAVLPTADVSDEAIGKALEDDTDVDPAECPGVMGEECPTGRHHHHSKGGTHRGTRETCELLGCYADRARAEGPTGTYPAVRSLLDAQAAAHAAEVEALRAQIDRDRIRGAEAVLNEQLRTSTAEAEVEALRAEKASMTEAYQAASASLAKANVAIANMDDNFDRQEAATEVALAEVRADRDAYRARIDAVRALCDLAPDLHGSMVWSLARDVLAALDGA